MARQRGTRPFIQTAFACEPGGCGARPGERCVSYAPKRDGVPGGPVEGVHAARWRAFRAWLDERQREGALSTMLDGHYQVLHENAWVSLRVVRNPAAGVSGYVYSHETRCRGRIVAVLPYRDVTGDQCGCGEDAAIHRRGCTSGLSWREYLVKSEMTPCWGFSQVLSAITGGYEGGDIEDDAVRELLEETGYAITREELIPLGESFASKSADTVYSLFTADLTGREAGEAIGDGTRLEAESPAVWSDAMMLAAIRDPQVAVMYVRIQAAP